MTQYKLISSSTNSATDPRDWQLLASNDGWTWTVLNSKTNQVFTHRRQARRYPLQNETPYRYYRLNITANRDGNDGGVRLAEFQLWSEDTPPVASASAEFLPWQSAAKAFDGDKDTKWYNNGAGDIGWLQYEFGGGEGRALSRYTLTSGNDVPERDPKDWQFQASNDGEIWTNLDTEANQHFESRQQTKSFSFVNRVPHRFFRLNITATRGAGQGLQLTDLDIGAGALTNAPPNPSAVASNNSQRDRFLLGTDTLANSFSLIALDDRTIAWGQSKWIWSLNMDSNSPQPLLDLQTAMPANTLLRSLSYSREARQFLLSCNTSGKDSLWRFDPDSPSSLVQVADTASDGVWVNGGDGRGAWVARQNNGLMVQRDPASAPVQIVPGANIDGITVSPDGRRLFLLGTTQDEPSAEIWQYDFASAQLKCAVPYGNQLSAYAKRENHSGASLRLASGETLTYNVFPPVNGNKYTHRKYPLVIGDTPLWSIMRGAHGRLWVSPFPQVMLMSSLWIAPTGGTASRTGATM